MHSTAVSQPIATTLISSQLRQQVATVPFLKPIVKATIEVTRVGFTRNASATPYIVYKVNNRKCCTFVKKIWFLQLVQMLLKVDKRIDDQIRSIISTEWWGLKITTTAGTTTVFDGYANKFFKLYNNVLADSCPIDRCECDRNGERMYGFCTHDVASILYPRIVDVYQPSSCSVSA